MERKRFNCVGKSVKASKGFQPPFRQQLMPESREMDSVWSEGVCTVLFFGFLHPVLEGQEGELILAGESFYGMFGFPEFREPVQIFLGPGKKEGAHQKNRRNGSFKKPSDQSIVVGCELLSPEVFSCIFGDAYVVDTDEDGDGGGREGETVGGQVPQEKGEGEAVVAFVDDRKFIGELF